MVRKIAQMVIWVFIFTIPWETAITISSLGTVSRVIGLLAAGIWLFSVLVEGRMRKPNVFHLFVFLFMLDNIASIFWSHHYGLTWSRVKTYAQLAILVWILWDLITTPGDLRNGMQAFILGGYVGIGSSLYNFITNQLISTWEVGRYTGASQNAVEFAMILSLSLPIAWHLAMTQKKGLGANLWRGINFAFIPAALFAIVLTGTRTALLSIIPGLIYILWTLRNIKMGYRLLIFSAFIVLLFVGQSLVPQSTLERLGTLSASIEANDLGGRAVLWKGALRIFQDYPILGVGSGSLSSPDELGAFAHNTFLSILAELGMVGFAIFMGVLGAVFLNAIRQPKPYAALSLSIFVIWIISVMSLTWEYAKPTWFFLNLIVIITGVYEVKEAPREQPVFIEHINGSLSPSQAGILGAGTAVNPLQPKQTRRRGKSKRKQEGS